MPRALLWSDAFSVHPNRGFCISGKYAVPLAPPQISAYAATIHAHNVYSDSPIIVPLLSSYLKVYAVGPHYPVKREGGLEQTRVYGHAVVYANTDRADGRVEAILPELGVFGKRPKSTGQYHHS